MLIETKSLIKAFNILELFLEENREELRLVEIAQLSGLKIATANRIAATLVKLGYLSKSGERGRYSIGKKFLYYTGIMTQTHTITDVVRPYLVKLNELTEETAVLVYFDGNRAYIIGNIISKHVLNARPDWIPAFPLHCTGFGKIFLAAMSKQTLEQYINNAETKSYTPNTITDLNILKEHLMIVRQEGVAYDDEEYLPGIRNIAAGIKDYQSHTFCSIGILGPTVRLTRSKMTQFAMDIKKCASDISDEIGYKRDFTPKLEERLIEIKS